MPKQVLPSELDFAYFADELEALGFREMTDEEFYESFKKKRLKAPRKRYPKKQNHRQVGFVFYAYGLRVCVWTTWLKKQDKPKKSSEAWVIIEDKNKALYFSHPIHRTKNFVINLLRQAQIARTRIINRPLCPKCNDWTWMKIVQGRSVKSRYWRCSRKAYHKNNKPEYLDWDCGISDADKAYLKPIRKKRAKYRKKRKKQGKPNNVAMKKRKTWKR